MNRIKFPFSPYKFEEKEHIVEKVEKGVKRKYLRGVSSGIMKDGQGERMTLSCIESMMKQGQSGNILLYTGSHGFDFVDDVGILTDSEIINKKDWLTEYRLHDELDEMPEETVGRAMKLWKQVNGLPPYKTPARKGFSVEGVVPEEDILDKEVQSDGSWTQRVINNIALDGVVVCTRPAYMTSVASAVYKFMGELHPIAKQKLHDRYHGELVEKINQNKESNSFFQKYFEINSVLEDKIFEIMKIKDGIDSPRLEILLDEYKNVMKNLILEHSNVFKVDPQKRQDGKSKSEQLMKQFTMMANQFSKLIVKKLGG